MDISDQYFIGIHGHFWWVYIEHLIPQLAGLTVFPIAHKYLKPMICEYGTNLKLSPIIILNASLLFGVI